MSIVTSAACTLAFPPFAFCTLGFVVPVCWQPCCSTICTPVFRWISTTGCRYLVTACFSPATLRGLPSFLPPLLICKVLSLSIQLAFYHSVLSPITLLSIHLQDFLFLGCPVRLHLHHLLHGGSHLLEYHREHPLFRCPQWRRFGDSVYVHHLFGSLYGSAHYSVAAPASLLSPLRSDGILYESLFYTPASRQQPLVDWNVALAGFGLCRSDACAASLPPLPQRVGAAVG